jgi:hypothetical protein
VPKCGKDCTVLLALSVTLADARVTTTALPPLVKILEVTLTKIIFIKNIFLLKISS